MYAVIFYAYIAVLACIILAGIVKWHTLLLSLRIMVVLFACALITELITLSPYKHIAFIHVLTALEVTAVLAFYLLLKTRNRVLGKPLLIAALVIICVSFILAYWMTGTFMAAIPILHSAFLVWMSCLGLFTLMLRESWKPLLDPRFWFFVSLLLTGAGDFFILAVQFITDRDQSIVRNKDALFSNLYFIQLCIHLATSLPLCYVMFIFNKKRLSYEHG